MADLVRLNLGSGDSALPGYVNLDIKQGHRAYPLAEYADGSVDEVRASHILEHFGHPASTAVLTEWIRVLKVGGLLKVAVPDFEWIAREYLKGLDRPDEPSGEYDLTGYVMGGWTDEYDRHGAIFDEEGMRAALEDLGMADIERFPSDANDCTSLPVSLNLQARKAAVVQGVQCEAIEERASDSGAFDWLRPYARNVYSQTGEDGILEAIYRKVGTQTRWCFEVGAGDGKLCSNTRHLIEQGWDAILVEGDRETFHRLNQNYLTTHERRVRRVCDMVELDGPSSLDAIMARYDAPKDLDLLVLDVDGQEWHLWNSLLHYRPRVVLCEYSRAVPADFVPERGQDGQAGLDAIRRLAAAKGYRVIGVTPYNVVAVLQPLAEQLAHAEQPAESAPPAAAPLLPSRAADDGIHVTDHASEAERVAVKAPPELKATTCAVLTVPRLMFTETVISIERSLSPLGVVTEYALGVFWGQCLSRSMRGKLDAKRYILTVDYDTVFCASDVLELWRLMEENPTLDAVVPVQMKRCSKAPLFHLADETGALREEVSAMEFKDAIVPIRAGHFGLTMLRSDALKRMPHPWFQAVPDPETGEWDEGRIDEDVNFWLRWRAAGNTVCVAPRVVVGHLEQCVTWPDRMLRPMMQHEREYLSIGKPAGAWR